MRDPRKTWLRIVLWALVMGWMALIYMLSAQVADDSAMTSGRVIRWLLSRLDKGFSALSPKEQRLILENWSFAVRKLAHFAIFTVLGFLSFAAFSVDLPRRRAFPAALGLGAACGVLDEIHQIFVFGRSCEGRDMCIDAAGTLLGAAFLLFLFYMAMGRKSKRTPSFPSS